MPNIRPARLSDRAAIARVCTAAFWNDVLFGDLIHPHRAAFPADNDLYWSRRFQVDWWDYRHRWLVTTAKDASGGGEIVTGVAHWVRLGEGGRGMECWWWDPRNLLHPLAALTTSLLTLLHPNRAASPTTESIIERSAPFLDHVWTGRHAECWYLSSLAVHPDHQGRGHGRALVHWGLDKARSEGVCASVISADGKEAFYRRCGFEREAGRSGEGEGNPLRDVPGGVIFFWEGGK